MKKTRYLVCLVTLAVVSACQPSEAIIATQVAEAIRSTETAATEQAPISTNTPVITDTGTPTQTTVPSPTASYTPTSTSTPTPTVPHPTLTAIAEETAQAVATSDAAARQTAVAEDATATQEQHAINMTATVQPIVATQTQQARVMRATEMAVTATARYLETFTYIDYRELRDYADEHKGERVCVRGRVFNIVNTSRLQLWFSGTFDSLTVEFSSPFRGIYEDDHITVCGVVQGYYSFQNRLDETIVRPYIHRAFVP